MAGTGQLHPWAASWVSQRRGQNEGVSSQPVLHLTVGLPGSGKTTLALRVEAATGGLRLTPDEWMLPLFGESEADGKRDVLEGRLIWVASRALLGGLSVIIDFGCWSAEERWAIRDVADRAGARFELHYLEVSEPERRARADARWRANPTATFAMSQSDHDRSEAAFTPPSAAEFAGAPFPDPPAGFDTWAAWAADRWPSLPDLGSGS